VVATRSRVAPIGAHRSMRVVYPPPVEFAISTVREMRRGGGHSCAMSGGSAVMGRKGAILR
jgi:hypothetical protein